MWKLFVRNHKYTIKQKECRSDIINVLINQFISIEVGYNKEKVNEIISHNYSYERPYHNEGKMQMTS